MTEPTVLKHLRMGVTSDSGSQTRPTHTHALGVIHHLPHQRVVVVSFNLAGVDQLSLKRTEARPFGDAAFIREHSTVGGGSP